MAGLSPMDRVKKAHISIMRNIDFCSFSGILSCGKVEVTADMPVRTACTDGWNVYYHPDFVTELDDAQLRFVVLHEATHKAYQHLNVWKHLAEENMKLANVAMDFFVNLALMDTDAGKGFITMPENIIPADPKYRGWNVQRIYDDLKQNGKGGKGKEDGKGKGKGGKGTDGGDDGEGAGIDSHDWANAKQGDAESARRVDEIQRAIRQGEIIRKKLAGKGAGNSDGMFGDILNPKVDWRKVLREFVMEFCRGRDESSWARPNRRFLSDDIYMPTMLGVTMDELVIGFDTSGSCFGTAEMTRFVTEVTAIIETVTPSKVHVIYWDTHIAGHQTFEGGQFAVQNLAPRGGGGTDGSVLFNYLREKNINPAAIVQLSDGYVGSWGDSTWPTLWALTTPNLNAPYGTTLYIGD